MMLGFSQDGTDAAARRRRAQLLGTLDEEEEDQQQHGKQWQLDFQYDDGQMTEEVQEAMFKEAEAHHRRLVESQTVSLSGRGIYILYYIQKNGMCSDAVGTALKVICILC
jgi:hypothetical protein